LPAGIYSARTWVDDNNGLFAITGDGILIDSGDLSLGTTHRESFGGNVPYSITAQVAAKFTIPAGSGQPIFYSNDNRVSAANPAPAPGGVLLLASAVPTLGCISWVRRRRNSPSTA
jgi:hypothetical protein